MVHSDSSSRAIHKQVNLPLSVAFEIVMQGIRIRLGRSLVTISGVVLGIAFLMSILSTDSLRSGVQAEEQLRQNARRMVNFVTSEIGPARDRVFGVLVSGKLDSSEIRMLQQLREAGAAELRTSVSIPSLEGKVVLVEAGRIAEGAHALLVLGDGKPQADWAALLATARSRILLATNPQALTCPDDVTIVSLRPDLQPDEKDRQVKELRQSTFRRRWIICVALLVTVICIANSMLMSVTERFKEIGTMKCLGALSAFIRTMFLIESSLMGMAGSLVGAIGGWLFTAVLFAWRYGLPLLGSAINPMDLLGHVGLCLISGLMLSVVAAIYPANIASNMRPAHALKTNI